MKIKYLQTPTLNYNQITYDQLLEETENGVFIIHDDHNCAVLHNGQLYYAYISALKEINQTLNTEVWRSDRFRRMQNAPEYAFAPYVENINTKKQVYP